MAALQIRNVSAQVHEALASEADRRGQSLQLYLLDVLEREAAAASNRRLLVDWAHAPLVADVEIDLVHELGQARSERDGELGRQVDRR